MDPKDDTSRVDESSWITDLRFLSSVMNDIIEVTEINFSGDASNQSLPVEHDGVCHSSTAGSPTGILPSMEPYIGPYNFRVKLNPLGKSSWLYSTLLEQVFIDMEKILMLQFHVDHFLPGMSVRALPVYSLNESIGQPVTRCPIHSIEDDPNSLAHQHENECLCKEYNLSGHVVRVYSIDAKYCYDKVSKRHSVIVPLEVPQAGSHFTEVPYRFMCKTSCSRGMQRRPIHLIFTLEDANGEVFGRSILAVKICSCPKRDKERMEKEKREASGMEGVPSAPKRLMASSSIGPHKKIKYELIPSEETDNKSKKKQIINDMRKLLGYLDQKVDELEKFHE